MITIVYWEEVESEYSEEAGEPAEVVGDSELLTATESIDDALDRVKKHQEETKGRDIEYGLVFWLNGELLTTAEIAENTDVDDHREDIKNFVKSYLH